MKEDDIKYLAHAIFGDGEVWPQVLKGKMRARIVKDYYAGYEVQIWRWWFPFWVQYEINTFSSIERAREFAKEILTDWVVEYVKEGE